MGYRVQSRPLLSSSTVISVYILYLSRIMIFYILFFCYFNDGHFMLLEGSYFIIVHGYKIIIVPWNFYCGRITSAFHDNREVN